MIYWYLLAAFSMAVCCHISIFNPALQIFFIAYPEDNVSKYKYISHFIILCGSTILAPILMFVYFSDELSHYTKQSFLKGLAGK